MCSCSSCCSLSQVEIHLYDRPCGTLRRHEAVKNRVEKNRNQGRGFEIINHDPDHRLIPPLYDLFFGKPSKKNKNALKSKNGIQTRVQSQTSAKGYNWPAGCLAVVEKNNWKPEASLRCTTASIREVSMLAKCCTPFLPAESKFKICSFLFVAFSPVSPL